MVGRNNDKVKREKITEKVEKYSIRKFKNGVASAVVGALLIGAGAANVDTVSAEDGNPDNNEEIELFSVDEGPVVEDPVNEDPVVEEPVVEDPVVEDPVVEEPVVEDPVVEEPVVEDPVVEEPVVEDPVEAVDPAAEVHTVEEARKALDAARDQLLRYEILGSTHGGYYTEIQYAQFAVDEAQENLNNLLVAEVEEAIAGLAFDKWYGGFPTDVEAAKTAYDALDENLQELVPNSGDLLVAEARVPTNDVIATVLIPYWTGELKSEDYTEASWTALEAAYNAAVAERDSAEATVESLATVATNLQAAYTNLEIELSLEEKIAEAREALAEAEDQLLRYEIQHSTHGGYYREIQYAEAAVEDAQEALDALLGEEVALKDLADVIAAIDGLTYDEWYWTFPDDVEAVREVYDALREEHKDQVTNYGDLRVAEARVNANTLLADHLAVAYGENKDGEYTEESWAAFDDAFQALRSERDNPDATEKSINDARDPLIDAADNLMTVEEEAVTALPIGVEVRGLDGKRTDDVRIWVTNADGESFKGSFNEWTQWVSAGDLPFGRYTITLSTPKDTYAVRNDSVIHGALPTDKQNVFTIDVDEDNLFGNSRVYSSFQLEERTYGLGFEVRGLDDKRTDDVRIRVTDAEGEHFDGSFNEWTQWVSEGELPVGRYTVTLRTPTGTYAVLNESVLQGVLPTDDRNVFTVDVDEDNLFNNSRVYGGFKLVMVEELAEVIAAIDDLAFDEWYRGFPTEVEEVKAAYDALDEDLQELVTNYEDLEIAEARVAINNVIREVRRDDLEEDDYTKDTWDAFVEAYNAAVVVRDNPDATVDSITKDLDDLQDAFDDLLTVKEAAWNDLVDRIDGLEDRVNELEEENEGFREELDDLYDELDDLYDELDGIYEDLEASQDKINELEKRITELENRIVESEKPTPEDPTGEDPADDDVNGDTDADDDDDRPAPAAPTDIVVKADDDDDDTDDTVVLPKTGVSTSGIALGVASLLSGLGLAVVGKKRKEDE